MVEAAAGQTREQIKQELMAKADRLMADFDSYETVMEDASKNYIAKQTMSEEGQAITLVKYRADGLTEEQWE